ncbi:MAG: sn-glycerol-1-phosphate dehydrogenase [bacterium]|nr:sn-glycerol-1-phosphate dehydrogenase [bacterium]
MENSRIQKALEAATETEAFILGAGCRFEVPKIFQTWFPDASAIVVADENTFEVAGKFVYEKLQEAQIPTREPFIFPGEPILHSDYAHIETLRDLFKKHPNAIPIAVGSGTINDLVKRTAFEIERRYLVVATAASVDGYSSFGAPITDKGFKKTMECPAPLAIVADIEILRNAPPEMTAAGYADLMSKIPAGADWIIADALGIDPIVPSIWDMVQPPLRSWVGAPKKLQEGDMQAFEHLFEGLTMSGFAMQAIRKSRPASGAEHLVSHIWDMQQHRDANGQSVSHGFQVSLGSLASIAMMETLLARDIRTLDIEAVCERWKSWEEREAEIQRTFEGSPMVTRVLEESRAKYLNRKQLRERLNLLVSKWDSMREKVEAQNVSYAEFKRMLAAAACPVSPEQINLSRERFRESFLLAQMIRDRYTILDLAYEMGCLEECVEEILASPHYL